MNRENKRKTFEKGSIITTYIEKRKQICKRCNNFAFECTCLQSHRSIISNSAVKHFGSRRNWLISTYFSCIFIVFDFFKRRNPCCSFQTCCIVQSQRRRKTSKKISLSINYFVAFNISCFCTHVHFSWKTNCFIPGKCSGKAGLCGSWNCNCFCKCSDWTQGIFSRLSKHDANGNISNY